MNNTDVDHELEEMLKGTTTENESEESTSGASDQKGESDTDDSLLGDSSQSAVDTESETETASDRAQRRIRELLEENESLKKAQTALDVKHESSNEIKEFLSAVGDEQSRELLEKFANVLEKSIHSKFSAEVSPVLEKVRQEKFSTEFDNLASKLPELAPYRESIKKSYMRNPGTNLQDVAKEIVFKVKMGTVKLVESGKSNPVNSNRNLDIESRINKLIAEGKSEEALKLAHKVLK